MLALGEVVEIDLVDLVDHLAHQLAGFHVVVGVLEYVAHDAAAITGSGGNGQALEAGKELVIDEVQQRVCPVMPSGFGRPTAPLQIRRDRRAIAGLRQLVVPDPDRR